jgi:hypothetical protein
LHPAKLFSAQVIPDICTVDETGTLGVDDEAIFVFFMLFRHADPHRTSQW